MATTPSYGDRPALQGYRRSFTVPARALSSIERAGLDKSDADANVLFSHPSARIVSFSPPTESLPSQSKETLADTDYPVDAIETLPWRSRTETLASTGAIAIEKVRGSSNFLKSADQKIIYPIMRNSQCWCVDGESKFVLRIGKFRYYRIELPSETEQDKERAEELKAVLRGILRFERTPCPFKRAFHVDLPNDAITPRRKGPWKRRELPSPTTPNTDPLPLRRTKNTRAWSLQGQTTPIQTYGRRGSDYGFPSSRSSSPMPRPDHDDYRPDTPSSLTSTELAGEQDRENGSTQGPGEHEDGEMAKVDDHGYISNSTPSVSSTSPDTHVELPQDSSDEKHDKVEDQQDMAPEAQSQVPLEEPTPFEDPTSTAHASLAQNQEESPPLLTSEEPLKALNVCTSEDAAPDTEVVPAVPTPVAPTEDVEQKDATAQLADIDIPALEAVHGDSIHIQATTAEDPTDSPQPTPEEHKEATREELVPPGVQDSGLEQPLSDLTQDTMSKVPEMTEAVTTADVQAQDDDALSRVSSVDSFHTTSSLVEIFPQAEKFDPFSVPFHQHRRELSELTVTASTVDSSPEMNNLLQPSQNESPDRLSTPGLDHTPRSDRSWPEVVTPSPMVQDLRQRLRKKRSLSPLPPATTVVLPPSSPSQGNHFTAAILQKACNVALVKPIEAVVLLVHILARIAGGATVNDLLSGDLFKRPDRHRRGSSFPDHISSPQHDSDDEDDFGMPRHHGRAKSESLKPAAPMTRSDEADSMFDLD
ncbi:inheritance of peroxisomes protein 1-domain-containing protein [Exophiala viscosa]|uniref:Inheritance of peroxisomes protein 1 n=1 Tax=Exophiala viscosa TaxID=2486360 RepID=A0AAN6DNQ5_9EURO|nr:inheritance of peroxisomes protein 1-domain-containing protein [Exophiala viscosa]